MRMGIFSKFDKSAQNLFLFRKFQETILVLDRRLREVLLRFWYEYPFLFTVYYCIVSSGIGEAVRREQSNPRLWKKINFEI